MPDALTKVIESTRRIGKQVQKLQDANRKSVAVVADQLAMARQAVELFTATEHHRRRAIIERKHNTAADYAPTPSSIGERPDDTNARPCAFSTSSKFASDSGRPSTTVSSDTCQIERLAVSKRPACPGTSNSSPETRTA